MTTTLCSYLPPLLRIPSVFNIDDEFQVATLGKNLRDISCLDGVTYPSHPLLKHHMLRSRRPWAAPAAKFAQTSCPACVNRARLQTEPHSQQLLHDVQTVNPRAHVERVARNYHHHLWDLTVAPEQVGSRNRQHAILLLILDDNLPRDGQHLCKVERQVFTSFQRNVLLDGISCDLTAGSALLPCRNPGPHALPWQATWCHRQRMRATATASMNARKEWQTEAATATTRLTLITEC